MKKNINKILLLPLLIGIMFQPKLASAKKLASVYYCEAQCVVIDAPNRYFDLLGSKEAQSTVSILSAWRALNKTCRQSKSDAGYDLKTASFLVENLKLRQTSNSQYSPYEKSGRCFYHNTKFWNRYYLENGMELEMDFAHPTKPTCYSTIVDLDDQEPSPSTSYEGPEVPLG